MNDESKRIKIFDFRNLFKNQKTMKIIVYGGLALLLLILISEMFSGITGGSQKDSVGDDYIVNVADYETQLERELKRTLSAIDGIGELTIMVTLDSLSETVYAERGASVKTVITPKVRGVAVICDGGGDIIVKQKIVELVSRVFGIATTRISVTN